MASNPFDPFRDLLMLQERMNRMFQESLSRSRGGEEDIVTAGDWKPPVDFYEAADRIVLRVDVPGIEREEIDLKIEGGALRLRGERRLPEGTKPEDYHRIERPLGRFVRVLSLPTSVDASRIRAELKGGVLEVTIPKRHESQAKPIAIDVT
jgi:HSP20 family protein